MQTAYSSPLEDHSPASATILGSILQAFAEPAHQNGGVVAVPSPEIVDNGSSQAPNARMWAAFVIGFVILCAAANLATFVLSRAFGAFP
jgi:hypothetical protein